MCTCRISVLYLTFSQFLRVFLPIFICDMLKIDEIAQQGYRYHKIRKAFSKFYRRHFDIVSKYNVGLKTRLLQGLTEPEFYGDLLYKFRKIIGKKWFSLSFPKDNYSL